MVISVRRKIVVKCRPVTEPQVTEPQVTEPQVTEPQVTEPQVTEPQVTEPQVTEPQRWASWYKQAKKSPPKRPKIEEGHRSIFPAHSIFPASFGPYNPKRLKEEDTRIYSVYACVLKRNRKICKHVLENLKTVYPLYSRKERTPIRNDLKRAMQASSEALVTLRQHNFTLVLEFMKRVLLSFKRALLLLSHLYFESNEEYKKIIFKDINQLVVHYRASKCLPHSLPAEMLI